MKKVGSRELKNRLGKYLKRVRRGETFLVTDRGVPVARMEAVEPEARPRLSVEDWLKQLEAEGRILRSNNGPYPDSDPVAAGPVAAKGKPASQIILEDRR